MKFFLAIPLLLLCSAFTQEVSVLPEPPVVTFPTKTPELLVQKLAKSEVHKLITKAAAKHNVPAAFVKSIVAAESGFDSTVVSPKGAIGLMQLMPETAEQFGADPKIPAQNIDAGTRYLRVLMDKYAKSRNSMKRVIAAYNAGPGVVDRYRGVPPYKETRGYVARVLNYMKTFEKDRS